MNSSDEFDAACETVDCDGNRIVAGMKVKILSIPDHYLAGYPEDENAVKRSAIRKAWKVIGVGSDGLAWFALSSEIAPGMVMGCDLALEPQFIKVVRN